MKKILLIAAVMFGFVVAASAQPRALGVRGTFGAEISYQHTLGAENFLEVDFGLAEFDGLAFTAAYNFMIAQPQWSDRGEWGFYAGPGATVAFGLNQNSASHFNVGIVGQIGLEYTFWFPLQLSLDLRPSVGYGVTKTAAGESYPGLYYNGLFPALGIRYRF